MSDYLGACCLIGCPVIYFWFLSVSGFEAVIRLTMCAPSAFKNTKFGGYIKHEFLLTRQNSIYLRVLDCLFVSIERRLS